MTIEIITASAGTNFAFRAGQRVSEADCENEAFLPEWVEILKEQVRCGHAIVVTGATTSERKVKDTGIEKR